MTNSLNSAVLSRISKRTLAANLERETQARLEAEKRIERQNSYIERMPYPSDLWQADETIAELRGLLDEWLDQCAAMGGGERSELTARTLAALEQTRSSESPFSKEHRAA